MDPDVVREFEEQIRQLTAALGNQSSAMGAMQNMQDKNTQFTSASNAAEQNKKKALDQATAALSQFTSAALSAEDGFKKYNNSLKSAGTAVSSALSSFGPLGTVIGKVVELFSMLAGESLALVTNMIKFRDETTKVAGFLPTTAEGLEKLSREAGYAGENFTKLQKITNNLGSNLVGLGGIAGKGVTKFMELVNVSDDVRRRFGTLGINVEELTAMQGRYVEIQAASGKSYELQTKSMAQLRKESLDYAENMVRLSSLTGKSADQLQKEQEAQMLMFEEQVKARQERVKIQELERQAANARTDEDKRRFKEEADRLRAESETRQKIIRESTSRLGPEMANQIGRVLRTGAYDKLSGSLATLGVDFQDFSRQLKDANPEEATEIMNNMMTQVNTAFDKRVADVGDAMQFGGEQLGKQLGITNEALQRTSLMGEQTAEQQEAAKDAAQRVAEGTSTWKQEEENRRKAERESQKTYQGILTHFANVILPAITGALKIFETTLKLVSSTMDEVIAGWDKVISLMKDKWSELSSWFGNIIDFFKNKFSDWFASDNKQTTMPTPDTKKTQVDPKTILPEAEPKKVAPSVLAGENKDDNTTQTASSVKKLKDAVDNFSSSVPTSGQSSSDTKQVMATIRRRESRGNYQAQASGSSASGAYQFIDSTWQELTKKYGIGDIYKSAKDAPPEIQDMIAERYVTDILAEADGDVSKVPLKWYTGNIQGKMSEAAITANGGQTASMYQSHWMADYKNPNIQTASYDPNSMAAKITKPPFESNTTEAKKPTKEEQQTLDLLKSINTKLDIVAASIDETNNINKKILQEARV